ncbi:MAG: hypothetical protein DME25_01520 [Verrucomicrobia bacterium]|nr:MAG: hypothetical protein DME25_01520 [Verrucomicrobiota bacterium]
MEPNEQTGEPTCYNGLFRHSVDEKRRVQVPADWRPSQPGVQFTLVVWSGAAEGPCLRGFPPQRWAELMKEIVGLPRGDQNKPVLKRNIGRKSVQAPLDKAGRICLPEEMAMAAGITDKAVLVGMLDQFEIWSAERWKNREAADEIMAQEAFRMME